VNAVPEEPTYVASDGTVAGGLDVAERARFIMRTYAHLLGAVIAFAVFELLLFVTGIAPTLGAAVLRGGPLLWLGVLGGFMVGGWVATRVAHTAQSRRAQYLALFGYVLIEALLFCPLLFFAALMAPAAIGIAALVTIGGFVALTAIVFTTRKDFSFMGSVLRWGALIALLMIAAGAVFGFNLGLYFSAGMVALAGGMVLYDTSNVLLHYPQDRYVAASLQLFASLALLFWYVLRIALSLMSRD
jgi:FtsH-binding integral membrane protein